jgi:ATP-binding cassette subfamily F protein 3
MISILNLSIHFTGKDLFRNVSFVVSPQERIGLVGKNGAGKTTLLNIITGKLQAQEGSVSYPKDYTIAYLHQELQPKSGKTVFGEALRSFEEILQKQEQIKSIQEEISRRTDYESKEYHLLIEKMTAIQEKIDMLGGNKYEAATEKVLLGLGFVRDDFHKALNTFSNGWQMRVELAKMLLANPDLLLLDEPTNHLDIESIQWLESYLKSFSGAILLVSHDKAFLNAVTNRTIEIANAKIYDYKTSYSQFVRLRRERLERQQAMLVNQEKTVKEMENFIERFRYKATKAKQVQSRVKQLQRMEEIEIDELEKAAIHFRFPPAPHTGKVVLKALHVSKSYGDKEVLKDLEFMIDRGEKIAFVGKNGEGKTSLVKMIMNEIDYQGTIEHGHLLKIGYLAQNHSEYLNPEDTVFDTLDAVATGEVRKQVRNILGAFLFKDDDIEKKVKVLSGGEKSRLSLAKLLLTSSNLLILDEPTNHLDMMSKDILKNALIQYDGTLIIVSHDRDFLQGLTTKVFEFRNKKIKEHLGDVYDFIRNKKLADLKELEINQRKKGQSVKKKSQQQLDYEQRKDLERRRRKIKRAIESIEEKIEDLEMQLKKKTEMLSNPDRMPEGMTIDQISVDYNRIQQELEDTMAEWEAKQELLEKI